MAGRETPSDRDFDVLPGSGDEDSLDADFLSGSKDWVSLSDHLRNVEAAMADILHALGLRDTPLGKSLMIAAHWHDRGKSVDKWQDRVKDHVARACQRLEEVAKTIAIPRFAVVAAEWQERLRSKDGAAEMWGKFPDARAASLDMRLNLSDPERAELSRKLRVPFRPDLRHEAASALAAWQSWLCGERWSHGVGGLFDRVPSRQSCGRSCEAHARVTTFSVSQTE